MIVIVSVSTTPVSAALTSPVISAQFEFNKNINQCTSTQMKLLIFVQDTLNVHYVLCLSKQFCYL